MTAIPKFRIRCSAIGKIMAGNVGASQSQLDNIAKMEAREKPMTKIQQDKYYKDVYARDNPELPAGAKTYCKEWLNEQIYGRRKELQSKHTRKGNMAENTAVQFLNNILLEEYEKNTVRKENEYMTGECDIDANIIRDIKCSWSSDTFPLLETELPKWDYYWQGIGYCNLYDKPAFSIDYCLINAPRKLIEDEVRRAQYQPENYDKTEEELFAYYHRQMTYDDIDPKLKLKSFYFNRDDQKIKEIEQRVIMCREYIEILKKGLPC